MSFCLFIVKVSYDLRYGRAEQTSRFFRIYMSQPACFDSLEQLFRRRIKKLMLESAKVMMSQKCLIRPLDVALLLSQGVTPSFILLRNE